VYTLFALKQFQQERKQEKLSMAILNSLPLQNHRPISFVATLTKRFKLIYKPQNEGRGWF
jgi:hypothetical protein